MKEIATVLSIRDNIASVEIKSPKTNTCEKSCSGCKGCSAAAASFIEVENTIGAKIGQEVLIDRKSDVYYKSVFLVYGFPMIMLFIGVILGGVFNDSVKIGSSKELLSIILGLVFWIGSYSIIKIVDKVFKISSKVKYVMVQTL